MMLYSEDLKRLAADFEAVLRENPEYRAQMYEEIGRALLAEVRGNIGGNGTVQGWQDAFVGSKGGYAAVRAKAKTYTQANPRGKKYAVGHITNAIENGHKQEKGRYVPGIGKKLKNDRVPGKHSYAEARSEAERIAYAAAERFAVQLAARMEGK